MQVLVTQTLVERHRPVSVNKTNSHNIDEMSKVEMVEEIRRDEVCKSFTLHMRIDEISLDISALSCVQTDIVQVK